MAGAAGGGRRGARGSSIRLRGCRGARDHPGASARARVRNAS
jgi:hypothetical protein